MPFDPSPPKEASLLDLGLQLAATGSPTPRAIQTHGRAPTVQIG